MTGWPILDREAVRLPTLPGHDDLLWATLVELTDLWPGEWTLIGGQMVFLHALEHGVEPPRVSTDLDVLVNARIITGGVREFVLAIEAAGFALVGVSPEGLPHRYQRGGVSIDVLAPEGLVRRPSLLGAKDRQRWSASSLGRLCACSRLHLPHAEDSIILDPADAPQELLARTRERILRWIEETETPAALNDRRQVRATYGFLEALDRQLGPERGPNGVPSTADFQTIELLRIVDRFAGQFEISRR